MSSHCRWTLCAILLAVALSAAGCMGIRTNKEKFLNEPERGMPELDLLLTYGKPDFSAAVEDMNVYVYSVINEKYTIICGVSGSYDLVITCRDGEVVDSKRVPGVGGMSLLQPSTWQVD